MMADYKNIGITNTLRILVGVVVYLNNVLRNKQFGYYLAFVEQLIYIRDCATCFMHMILSLSNRPLVVVVTPVQLSVA